MNFLYAFLLCAAFAVIQVLTGGTRQLFALPAYSLLALAALASLRDLRRSKLPPDGWCLASSLVFFGYVLVRAALSPVAYLAWNDAFMVLAGLMVYLLTACYFTDPRRRLWVLAGWVVLAACNLAVGARQFGGDDRTTILGFRRAAQYAGRASGFYICPDHLAGFLEIVICLCLAMMVWSRSRAWVKILCGYAALCCLAGLAITGSRGGYISLTFGCSVLVLLTLWRIRVTSPERLGASLLVVFILVALLVGGGLFALKQSRTLSDRVTHLVDTQDIRVRLWPSAIREFQEAPAFGTGSSTFLYYGRRFRDPAIQLDPIRTHNDYLELLAEYGVAGAVGLLFFLAAHARAAFRTFYLSARRSAGQGMGEGSNAVAWNIGAMAAVACLLAHSVVDFNLHIPANVLAMAFIFGVIANPGRSLEAGGDSGTRTRLTDLVPRLVLPVLAVVILVQAYRRLPGEYYTEQARVALRDGKDAAALNLARQGVERGGSDPQLYSYLGRARSNLGGTGPDTLMARSFREAAAQAFEKAVELAPPDSLLQARLGETYARLNRFPDAGKTFRQALFWDPNSSWVLTQYGFYLQQAGLYAQAGEAYRQALGLQGNWFAQQNLEQISRSSSVPNLPLEPPRGNGEPESN